MRLLTTLLELSPRQFLSSMNYSSFTRCVVLSLLASAALLTGGCASIVHGGDRKITIATQPTAAKATITKLNGDVVSVSTTPCTVSLDPKRGYFKGQTFTLKLELPGYQTAQVELHSTVSGWYFGNLLLGGVIGMLAVDPVTGAMWNIQPDKIDQSLTASQASLIRNRDGFVVVLASQLTSGERAHSVRIN
jgi:hypothetical protein